jgi:hypothetical protein
LPRLVYRAELDRLAEVRLRRAFGESRERFAARLSGHAARLDPAHKRAPRSRFRSSGSAARSRVARARSTGTRRASRGNAVVAQDDRRADPLVLAADAIEPASHISARVFLAWNDIKMSHENSAWSEFAQYYRILIKFLSRRRGRVSICSSQRAPQQRTMATGRRGVAGGMACRG